MTPRLETDDTAGCRQPGVNPDWWFPDTKSTAQTERATNICNGVGGRPPCPFRAPCLEYALANREDGVWGGMTESQRAKLARRNGTTYARPNLRGLVVYGPMSVVPHGTSVGVEHHRRHYMPLCDKCQEYDEGRKAS